jgi:hypothetical protein
VVERNPREESVQHFIDSILLAYLWSRVNASICGIYAATITAEILLIGFDSGEERFK